MDSKIYFAKIYIIEWLNPGDARTGRQLYDELDPMGLMSNPVVTTDFKSVSSRDEFLAHLRAIRDDFRTTRRLPLLQLETHGVYVDGVDKVPTGIGANGGSIQWDELMRELIPLNRMTGLRLFINMASCGGLWGIKMLQPSDRAAFMAILGRNRQVCADELVRANIAFYRELFGGGTGNTAIDAMNATVAPKPLTFGAYNCEKLFMEAYSGFLKTACVEPMLTNRVRSLVTKLVAQRYIDTGQAPTRADLSLMQESVRRTFEAHADWFRELRQHYFFIDEIPENDARFPVTLADCEAAAA